MSLYPGTILTRRAIDAANRALERRWVKVLLFVAVFLAAWLHAPRTAHALEAILSLIS